MDWFRVYHDVIMDHKVQRMPIECRWRWVEMLCLCSKNDPRGELPGLDEVAFKLRISAAETEAVVRTLMDAGLIDKCVGSRKLRMHHWEKWQRNSDDVATRVKRHRKQKCNVTNPLPSRARASDSDSEQRQNRKTSPTSSSNGNGKLEMPKVENEPPEFPESNGMFIVMPGDHPMSEIDAREIWGDIWRAWKNPKLCFAFYEHQQWVSKDGWIYAIRTTIKANGRPGSIKYLETIGVDFDINGAKPESPVQRGVIGSVPYKPQGPTVPTVKPMTDEERAADKAESDRLMAAYRERQNQAK